MPKPEQFEAVESSQIGSVYHDTEEKTLYITFRSNGAVWSYKPVSERDYKAFRQAESLGSFFNKHIKYNPGITAEKQ